MIYNGDGSEDSEGNLLPFEEGSMSVEFSNCTFSVSLMLMFLNGMMGVDDDFFSRHDVCMYVVVNVFAFGMCIFRTYRM